ncbi:hypothetical protein AYI69_g4601 [Smittium culicis]|uniref:Uncharacterized protein n=1 Tax=Smittium culicis TaxID=133412 RepID=A0A1R1YCC9_9FUNG|nr:hypothetical protein AYI69_g4601 [Smittium culicis]
METSSSTISLERCFAKVLLFFTSIIISSSASRIRPLPISIFYKKKLLNIVSDFEKAEKHLLHGSLDSAILYGKMLFVWSRDEQATDLGLYVSRGVYQYLANGLVEHASECLKSFMLSYKSESFEVEKKTLENATKSISLDYAPDSPLLNCCSLVLAAVNKSNGQHDSAATRTFLICRRRYSSFFGPYEDMFKSVSLFDMPNFFMINSVS